MSAEHERNLSDARRQLVQIHEQVSGRGGIFARLDRVETRQDHLEAELTDQGKLVWKGLVVLGFATSGAAFVGSIVAKWLLAKLSAL